MLTDEDILFTVEDSLAGSRPVKEAWPSYGMSEEVAVPQGKGIEVIMVDENAIVETKERVLREAAEIKREWFSC